MPPWCRYASPPAELGHGAGLAGQFPGAGLGAQRGQNVRHGLQLGRDIPFPGKQHYQVGVRHGGPVLERRLRDVRHVIIRNVGTGHSVTPVSAVI
jgi:hypothetical protein